MKNIKFTLVQKLYDEMIAHCRSELPYEACGIVSGVNEKVDSVWKLTNESKSKNRYFVGKDNVQNTLNELVHKGEKILGIYHSHPTTSAIPSRMDLINHPYPNVKMLIVSFKKMDPVMKCYEIKNQHFVEITLIVN